MSDLPVDPGRAVDIMENAEVKVVSPLIDLEVSLSILPEVHRRLRRLMEIKGIAEMMIRSHLTTREGKQRVYGNTVYGLKDGKWEMEAWEALALLRVLRPFVGDDFTQEQLDKAIALVPVEVALKCEHDGDWVTTPVCPKCAKPAVRLIVDHRGINALHKVARKDIKDAIEKARRRAEPTIEMTARK